MSLPSVSTTQKPRETPVEASGYKAKASLEPAMADLIVQSAVKEELADNNVSGDFYEALDEEVSELLADAARRASDNDRKTVQTRDL